MKLNITNKEKDGSGFFACIAAALIVAIGFLSLYKMKFLFILQESRSFASSDWTNYHLAGAR
ncbi:MAG TPA: hypothetical protein VGP06_05885 [Janthinobacterium sp.]|nr:hypothetical protein [Janthinobacterium sp.]